VSQHKAIQNGLRSKRGRLIKSKEIEGAKTQEGREAGQKRRFLEKKWDKEKQLSCLASNRVGGTVGEGFYHIVDKRVITPRSVILS